MAVVKKRKTADAWKKKEWYTIVSPKEFDQKEVGNTPTDKDTKLINRVIWVPLRDITGDPKQQFTKLRMKVKEVKGKTAYTELAGFEMNREFVRRNVRRRRSIIEITRTVKTKDNKEAQFTISAFTQRKVDTSKKDQIRHKMMELIDATAHENSLEEMRKRCLLGSFGSDLTKVVKPIAPMKRIEVSKCEITGV